MSGDHAKKEVMTGEKPATSHRKTPSGESGNKGKVCQRSNGYFASTIVCK
jgi:hypothetical protein